MHTILYILRRFGIHPRSHKEFPLPVVLVLKCLGNYKEITRKQYFFRPFFITFVVKNAFTLRLGFFCLQKLERVHYITIYGWPSVNHNLWTTVTRVATYLNSNWHSQPLHNVCSLFQRLSVRVWSHLRGEKRLLFAPLLFRKESTALCWAKLTKWMLISLMYSFCDPFSLRAVCPSLQEIYHNRLPLAHHHFNLSDSILNFSGTFFGWYGWWQYSEIICLCEGPYIFRCVRRIAKSD